MANKTNVRLLICGDRKYKRISHIGFAIRRLLEKGIKIKCIIEGEAKGADTIARQIGKAFKIKVKKYPADWDRFGRSAGPIRNTQMLKEGKPNLVFAFHDHIGESKGTYNMVEQCVKAGVPVVYFAEHVFVRIEDMKTLKEIKEGSVMAKGMKI